MKTLDGQTIFTYMTNLSDKFIEEAAYPLPASHEPTSVKPSWWQKAGHLVNSPVGVALICGVVSLGILAGIVIAGRNAPPTPPVGGTVSADTEVESEVFGEAMTEGQTTTAETTKFSFSFEFYGREESVPEYIAGGGGPALYASVTNLGAPFTFEGLSDGFVPNVKFVHSQTGHELLVEAYPGGEMGTFTVQTGQIGKAYYSAITQESDDTGYYDLILSYGGESQVFPQVIRVYGMGELTQKEQEKLPLEPEVVTSYEKAIEVATAYIQAQNTTHPFPLEELRASVYSYDTSPQTREYRVSFVYDLGGIMTNYRIHVTVHPNGNCTNYNETQWDENSYFLLYTDQDVTAAIERMDNTYEGPLYFEENEGKLYICKEVIVADPEHPEEHIHKFFREEVRHEDK